MSDSPGDLFYTKDHEWVRIEDDGSVVLGVTQHAQESLGDLVYVELPEIDMDLNSGDGLAVVESVKAASDVYAPCAGRVLAGNEALADSPELINSDPYGDGWIAKMTLTDRAELDGLMSADDYDHYVEEQSDD